MCKEGEHEEIMVKIPADLSSTEREKWRFMKIDKCIAPIVRALQEGGIDMRGSCCGHGKTVGDIHLQGGRTLIILSPEQTSDFFDNRVGLPGRIWSK